MHKLKQIKLTSGLGRLYAIQYQIKTKLGLTLLRVLPKVAYFDLSSQH